MVYYARTIFKYKTNIKGSIACLPTYCRRVSWIFWHSVLAIYDIRLGARDNLTKDIFYHCIICRQRDIVGGNAENNLSFPLS